MWLPDEWAVYIANGDDPEEPRLANRPVRRGAQAPAARGVRCRDVHEPDPGARRVIAGFAGTMRAYEALRTGGNDTVVRRVTLVQEHVRLPAGGEHPARSLLDVKLDLTRTESQPLERLVARAWRAGHGARRRGRAGRSDTSATPASSGPGPTSTSIPPPDHSRAAHWSDGTAVRTRIEARNCVGQVVLKQPDAAIAETALPAAYRAATFSTTRVKCAASGATASSA